MFKGSGWDHDRTNVTRTLEPDQQSPALIQETVQMMLEGIVEPSCLIGADGTILAVNHSWIEVTDREEYIGLQLGANFLTFTREMTGENARTGAIVADGLAKLFEGRRKRFKHQFKETGPRGPEHVRMHMVSVDHKGERFVLLRCIDISETWRLKREKRFLSARVAHAAAYERRHIARDLRESTERLMSGLELSFLELGRCADRGQMEASLTACSSAVDLVQRKVRAVSFLCHPPSLEGGLIPALEALVSGFCQRLGIDSNVEIRGLPQDVPRDAETMLYRVAQEALRNALHFQERTAIHLRLTLTGTRMRFIVEDIGYLHSHHHRCVNADLSSLKQYVDEMGGHFSLIEQPHGTRTIASLPLD